MKKMVLGIILSLSVTFLIGISNAKALIKTTFGDFPDLPYQSDYYLITQTPGSTSTPRLVIGASGCSYSKFFTDIPPYDMAVGYYNNSNYVISGTNCTLKAYQLLNNSWSFITNISAGNKLTVADGTTSQANIATSLDLVSRTNVNNVVVSAGTNLITCSTGLLINIDRVSSYSTNLLVTLDNTCDITIKDTYYSYNNSDWYSLGIDEAGEVATLPVYTNGGVYFKILDSEDNIIYSTTYNVTGMPSISGYSLYEILSGNMQVYISNLGNNTTGNFYIPYGMKGFSESFNYLDINGDYLGSSIFNYKTYEDLNVDTVSGSDNGLVLVPYDFSSYVNTKVISFNHNSDDNLIIWIPTGFYVDYVDLRFNTNYHCEGDSNITDSINLAKCHVKFDIQDNGVVSEVNDNSLDLSFIGNSEYFNQVVQVTKFNMPILKGVTKDFTLFINSLDINLKYGFFFIFATFFIVVIMKMSKL